MKAGTKNFTMNLKKAIRIRADLFICR
jgi:hypothetical protein